MRLFNLYFTRRVSIVTAVHHFVIVDFKEMNE